MTGSDLYVNKPHCTAAAQCGLFTYKSVPVIFEPPCIFSPSFIIITLHHRTSFIAGESVFKLDRVVGCTEVSYRCLVASGECRNNAFKKGHYFIIPSPYSFYN